jgi:SAM-dependent methyltransferase
MSERPWYATFFDQTYLDRYEPLLSAELSERQVDFMIDLLGLEPGAAILDLACGHGRHAIRLAQRGFAVTGLDLSEVFLDRARADAEAAGVEVEWVHADMREIPFENAFDAVVNIFTAFGYLENDAEDAKVVAAVRRALVPGGAFLLETIHRDGLIGRFQPHMFERHDERDMIVLHDHELDHGKGTVVDRVTLIEKGRIRDESHTSVRLYTIPELRRMFEEAGLELEAFHGNLKGEELTLQNHRLVVVGRAPGAAAP